MYSYSYFHLIYFRCSEALTDSACLFIQGSCYYYSYNCDCVYMLIDPYSHFNLIYFRCSDALTDVCMSIYTYFYYCFAHFMHADVLMCFYCYFYFVDLLYE